MKILLAKKRGFCPGVQHAIDMAKSALETYGIVYSLGEIIHNQQVVSELTNQGLKIVESVDQVPEGATVLIRSHGVGPAVFQQARERNLTVVDATCVLVKRAQKIVQQLDESGYQVMVIGDPNHPEVRGIVGYAQHVMVVNNESDLTNIPKFSKIGIAAQTTLSRAHLAGMVAKIIENGFNEIRLVSTLCEQAVGRQLSAVELAKQVDVMFVLGGMHSANTRELAQLSSSCGTRTYHLENFTGFEPGMIRGAATIGITAGASTPENIVQEFVSGLEKYEKMGRGGSEE
ncbi:MAG: 4-hydroxy-3-methylbut-2-enyl diphosphate reductase [Phycisphaerae bacterium]|nr:4-hydroxy-3-methylbut-2-enyl diphosphate reductase [Phycisphaerae bacterium]